MTVDGDARSLSEQSVGVGGDGDMSSEATSREAVKRLQMPARSPARRYCDIHSHCLHCIAPMRCVERPRQLGQQWMLSPEEVDAMLLDVNYHQHYADADYGEEDFLEVNGQLQRCPVIRCTNGGCHMVMHFCKLDEHLLLCQFQKMSCINEQYGCPFSVHRRHLSAHLAHCPARVVHCSVEWNRWPLHTTEKSTPSQVFCSPHSLDTRNLDVALALRDQRMLKQLWSASRQMKRIMRGCLSIHPAVPIKPYIGIRTYREYHTITASTQDPSGASPIPTIHCANIDEERYLNYAGKLVEMAYRESLTEIIRRAASFYKAKLIERQEGQARKKSNSVCQMMLTDSGQMPKTQLLTPLSAEQSMPSSCSINLPILSESDKQLLAQQDVPTDSAVSGSSEHKNHEHYEHYQHENYHNYHNHPPPPPPVPRCNALSLEISIRSYAFYQPKPRAMYTFRCGSDFRADELAAHYRDIHADIHGGLDGWIEHRCPMFQYGCTFIHRRLSPHSPFHPTDPPKTIVYNEHMETFACKTLAGLHDLDELNFLRLDRSARSSMCSEIVDFDHCARTRSSTSSEASSMAMTISCGDSPKRLPSAYTILSNSSSPLLLSPTGSSLTSTPRSVSMPPESHGAPSLSNFPFEILQHICTFLDGYSLNNLSFTSQWMRQVVQSFLKRKGYVVLQWKRYETERGRYQWKVAYKKWMFSTGMAPIKGWTFDATNVMAHHLAVCPFYGDRSPPAEPFRYVPHLPQKWFEKTTAASTPNGIMPDSRILMMKCGE